MKKHKSEDRNGGRTAWKRYGALVMAGVLLAGTGGMQASLQARADEDETEKRITLNVADDKEDEMDTEEAAEETETEVKETEAETEETETEAETEETETEAATEEETEPEEKETFAEIDSVDVSGAQIITTDVSGIVEACMPSIVSITNKAVQEVETYYYGTQEYENTSTASGVIVAQNDDELLIATNNHVIADSTELTVCFNVEAEDEEDLIAAAKVKGTDARHELAVVAVQLSDIPKDVMGQLKIAKLGSSDDLKVGQAAIAIGNALGIGQSVTSGIISALNKDIDLDNYEGELIQTDAAVNFGNSGGALLNASGEVIGINLAKETGDYVENMGYAIPIDTAIPILERLVNRQTRDKVEDEEHGYLGITVVNVSEDAKDLYNMPAGAFVQDVTEGSAAEKAGIKKGDVITKFDGIDITSHTALVDELAYYKVGETVTVEVQTANGGEYESREVEVTLQGDGSASDKKKKTDKKDKEAEAEQESRKKDAADDVPDYGEDDGFSFFPFFGDADIF